MARKDPDKYLGRWQETQCEELTLPFAAATLRRVVAGAAQDPPQYSHQQVAHWAERFWFEVQEGSLSESVSPPLRAAAEVAQDIDAQWGLFLINEFTDSELKNLDFSSVQLPEAWFDEWLSALDLAAV